jgi:glycosyltransferase involved in cell wall biosynthesis
MASERDIDAARALCGDARLRYVPNVVDVAAISPVRRPRGGRRALFVADFSYEPNRNAADFLLSEVMPRVWGRVSDARLTVAGAGLPPIVHLDPRVEVPGFVGDLAAAYRRADCVVVPLLQGGGSPLKFVEALAFGLPVLATPGATVGLEGEAGRHYLEADGVDAFADALAELLVSGAPEVAAAGRRLAEERYSIETLAGVLAA